jgi:uncharacterized protein YndB with AHSA1/START domain
MSEIIDWLDQNRRALRIAGKTRSAVITRNYSFTVPELWDACTERSRLARWFGKVEGQLEAGGEFTVDVGLPHLITCRLLECEEPRRLLLTWSYAGDPVDPPDEVEVRFRPNGDGATLELEHRSGVLYPWVNDVGSGWESWIWGLERALSGEPDVCHGAPEAWGNVIQERWRLHEPAAELLEQGQRRTLRFQRKLPFAIEKVWSVMVSSIGRWYPGRIEGELTPGNPLRFVYEDGTTLNGSVVAFEPPNVLVLREENEEVSARLTSRQSATLLTFEHSFEAPGAPSQHSVGWDVCLDELAHAFDGTPTIPLTTEERATRRQAYEAYFAQRNYEHSET